MAEGWPEAGAVGEVEQVAVDEVHDPGWRPAIEAADPNFRALKASVRASGVLQPLLVRPRADGGYEVVSGVRRLAAARATAQATVPALVRDLTELEAVLGSWDALRRTPMTEPAGAALHGRLLEAGMSAAEAETLIRTLTVVRAPAASGPEAPTEAEVAPTAAAAPVHEAITAAAERALEEAAAPVAVEALPGDEAVGELSAAEAPAHLDPHAVALGAPDIAADTAEPEQLVLADLPDVPERGSLEALDGDDVYDEILYDDFLYPEDNGEGAAAWVLDEFDFEDEFEEIAVAVPEVEVASTPVEATVPAGTALEQPDEATGPAADEAEITSGAPDAPTARAETIEADPAPPASPPAPQVTSITLAGSTPVEAELDTPVVVSAPGAGLSGLDPAPAPEPASEPAAEAAASLVAPTRVAAASRGVLARLVQDPRTYATAGTFIVVWAVVFDLVIVALGTSGNTRLLVAGAMVALVGFILAIASLAIPQPAEEAGSRR